MNQENKLWQFSPIPNIEESNFNKILERFFNLRISGLNLMGACLVLMDRLF